METFIIAVNMFERGENSFLQNGYKINISNFVSEILMIENTKSVFLFGRWPILTTEPLSVCKRAKY